jgi:membrane protein implicated in regulation of membrane protease activity
MPAKDIAGIAGVIFVLTSGVAIFAELTDSAGATLQTLRLAAYGIVAALLLVAFVLHRRERRPEAKAPGLTASQQVPGQRRARASVRSR